MPARRERKEAMSHSGPFRAYRFGTSLSCPTKRERGTILRSRMVEGAWAERRSSLLHAPLHHPSGGPPPPLRFTPRGRISECVPATRMRPSFAHHHGSKKCPPQKKRGAERRKAHQPCPAPSLLFLPPFAGRIGRRRGSAPQPSLRRTGADRLLRARSPFGAHACGTRKASRNQRKLSPGPCFPGCGRGRTTPAITTDPG
jgi:hypothetical protein